MSYQLSTKNTCTTCFVTSHFPNADINETGQCRWCRAGQFDKHPTDATAFNQARLTETAQHIKEHNTGSFDCVIGVSGGLDSSYVAYIARNLMELNPLLIHYDHGFFYPGPKENIINLANAINSELRILKSKANYDQKYVGAVLSAFSKSNMYWGICSFCHYILPAVVAWVAQQEKIPCVLVSSNAHESSLHVPKMVKLKAMLKAIWGAGLLSFPAMFYHLARAQYYLLRLKWEFYVPPLSNLFRRGPKTGLETVNVTAFVPWEINKIKTILMDEVGWRLPEHPNLGMRFDCMIEDSYINHTYQQATGATIHGIIANNLIYDGLETKTKLEPVVNYYNNSIEERTQQVSAMVHNQKDE